MYTLTLTQGERAAFDWVGNRYATGDEFADILRDCMSENDEWSQNGDMTFNIPEHKAWELMDISQKESSYFPCFGPKLVEKLFHFLDSIV